MSPSTSTRGAARRRLLEVRRTMTLRALVTAHVADEPYAVAKLMERARRQGIVRRARAALKNGQVTQ